MMNSLEECAESIPSMGGRENAELLKREAARAPSGTAVVEVGTWLGAGTAQLALGVLAGGQTPPPVIHCFDQWRANKHEVQLAEERGSVSLQRGGDTLPLVRSYLDPFGVPIKFHKCRIEDAAWSGPRISVYVDDASKRPEVFRHVLRTFGPHWIPGATTIILMDYLWWSKEPNSHPAYRCQTNFIEAHPDHFTPIDFPMFGSVRAFRYERALEFSSIPPFPAAPKSWQARVPRWVRSSYRLIVPR